VTKILNTSLRIQLFANLKSSVTLSTELNYAVKVKVKVKRKFRPYIAHQTATPLMRCIR